MDRRIGAPTLGVAEGIPAVAAENAKSVVIKMKDSSPVQNYMLPAVRSGIQIYRQSSTSIKVGLLSFGAMGVIPLGCFIGFMAIVTLGCLIVAGIGIMVVEGGFFIFASTFLLPALGFALLIASGLTMFSLTIYGCYFIARYIVNIFRGQTKRPEPQKAIHQGRERIVQAVEQAGPSVKE
ncbi:hypothetical protein BGW38_004183 [Lunasporangiospora selenospora]|uniref:Uncharacterized protein n=1 Tax=Lunasporangiospora selenospora TaxID=979761 RepID=A0A9P6KC72_9FUNG|nr:hypothetical protein BGW38_004183 [Lunasporangiospora selenospora]